MYIALKSNNCPKRYLITKENIKNLNYLIISLHYTYLEVRFPEAGKYAFQEVSNSC